MAFAISVALLSLCGGAQAARHLRQAGNDAPSAASLLAGAPAPAKSYNYTKWAGRTYNMAALPGLPANGQVRRPVRRGCAILR